MAKEREQSEQTTTTWGTWEELLLASAVKRHGFDDWNSVAMEVQARSSLPHLLTTAQNCQNKFHDLKRRFGYEKDDGVVSFEKDNGAELSDRVDRIPWLDELRKLRVAELRQEVQRSDVSIISLQLKVKRLEQEREKCIKEKEDSAGKPDLEDESREQRSENDKKDIEEPDRSEPGKMVVKTVVPGEDSDREYHSVNASNSTGSKSAELNAGEENAGSETKPDLLRSDRAEPVRRDSKPVGADSDNGSSDTVAKNPACEMLEPSLNKKVDDSSEIDDSAARSNGGEEGMRESSEVQSSASLTGKKKRNRRMRKNITVGSSGGEPPPPGTAKLDQFDQVLRMIRAHKNSSLFESRVQIQESDNYKNIVRQHLDLETIQAKLLKGSYFSCASIFYRDLLLLVNNSIIFFPKSSLESITAYELRRLILNKLKKTRQVQTDRHPSREAADSSPPFPSQSKKIHQLERSDSLLAKQKSSAPIIVCRKRSSISAKPSSASFGNKVEHNNNDEKKSSFDLKPPVKPSTSGAEEHGLLKESKAKEKPVTGTRSLRRSGESIVNGNTPSLKRQNTGTGSKAGAVIKSDSLRTDKKRTETVPQDKKRGAADFLKRIKQNSTAETLNSRGGGSSGGGEQKKGGDKGKERVLRQNRDRRYLKEDNSPSKRSVGRPPKKAAESNAGSMKRARESGGKDTGKRPRKRSRR